MSNFIQKGSKKCLKKILNSIKVKDIFANADNPQLSICSSTHMLELESLLEGEGETFVWSDSFCQNLLTLVAYQTGKKPRLVYYPIHTTGEFFLVDF